MCNYIEVFVISIIDPPREDQCEWHRMTRMTGPDCVVMCNLINTYIHTRKTCARHFQRVNLSNDFHTGGDDTCFDWRVPFPS